MKSSDIFIMFPVSGKLRYEVNEETELANKYCKILSETSLYECDSEFARTINRKSIGNMKIAYMSDEYASSNKVWINATSCYIYQDMSDLGILQIILPTCKKENSQIGDIVFSGHLELQYNNQNYTILEFVKFLGLRRTGGSKIVYCNNRKENNDVEVAYLLAGETEYSEHIDYKIKKERIQDLISKNHAQYDFYDLYASSRCIVYLFDRFTNSIYSNLEYEALLLFICEIAILQNAAIGRINAQIVDELMTNSNISANKTLKLQVEFGKTVMLWDNTIYKYFLSQELSDCIVAAFGTNKLLDEYNRNSQYIEQIASLKNGIASQIEGKILNILAFILSVSELIQMIKNAYAYIGGHDSVQMGVSGGGIALFIIILILIRRRIRK